MSARAFEIHPAQVVTDTDDTSAVLFKTGIAAFGVSIAEARSIAQRLALAADTAALQLALRERLKNERRDAPRYSLWDEVAALEAGKPLTGPL